MFKMNLIQDGIPLGAADADSGMHPIKLLALVVQDLASEMDGSFPEFYRALDKSKLRILYPGLSVDVTDFLASYGALLGRISDAFALSVTGLANSREEGLLEFYRNGGYSCSKSSTSGDGFAVLAHICLQLEFRDSDMLDLAREVLLNARGAGSAAVSRRWDAFPMARGLFERFDFSYFRYICLDGDTEGLAGDLPSKLTLSQIVELWRDYLTDGTPWFEFEQAAGLIREDGLSALYKWEIALKIALDDLGLQIMVYPSRFEILDKEGAPVNLHIGYNSTDGARKLLAKLIFPA